MGEILYPLCEKNIMNRILLLFCFLVFQFGFGQTTWTGTTNTDWNTSTNWSAGVPDAVDAVTIPNVTNKPTISVVGAVCASLVINNTGGSINVLSISSPGTLVVTGAITIINTGNSGTIQTTIAVGTGTLTAAAITMNNTDHDNRDCILSLSTGIINISGNITMNGPTNRNKVAFTGAGILNIGGNMTGGDLTPSTGSVNYNFAGVQNVGVYIYNNLILSGSGTKTFGATISIGRNLSIASGVFANLNTSLLHAAGTLTLGGMTTPLGTWGGTTSGATNINSTYFATAAGILTVGTPTCTYPIVYTITGSGNLCAGSAGNPIGLSNSEIGVNYQLVRNGVDVGSAVAGTGSAITFGLQNVAGDYTVIATINSTFCKVTMAGIISIYISSLPPVPVSPTIVNSTCTGSIGSITLVNLNHALAFNGTNQQVNFVSGFLSNLSAFTMEGWIKYKTTDLPGPDFRSLFGQNDVIEFGFKGTQLHLYTEKGGNIYATPPVNLGDNNWHHIAAVGTGSLIMIYVDGVVVGTGGNANGGNYGSSSDRVRIGAGVFTPLTDNFFKGQIMKVGFYNRALSAATIAGLAYSPITYTGSETGLIAGYNFLEGINTTLNSLPPGRNGTLINTPTWVDPYTYAWTKTGAPTYSAITKNIATLSSGTYNLSFGIGRGCPRTASYTVGNLVVDNTWNGLVWSILPTTGDHNLIFNGNYSLSTDLTGCSCVVNAGKKVTIPSGFTLKIANSVAIAAGGDLIFEDKASLVQTNDAAVNVGIIAYKRISASMKNFDFTYWSSPVENQIMNVLSPNTLSDKYFSFAGNDWVYEAGGSSMVPARGYIIRVPKPNFWPDPSALTYAQPVEFKGKANNGIQTFAAETAGSYNLIGNPYPSAVDAKLFLEANSSVLKGTLYYWTHTTAITPSGSFYEYNSDDYATYTLAGGVATKRGNIKPDGTYDDSKKPTDYIPAGKSFFVESLTAGTVNFNNAMRVSGNINQFSRFNTKTGKANSIERHRVWLNLTNTQGLFKQMLVAYLSDATNEFDNSFDGESFDGNTFADFYSVNSSKNLTIQGRALPFDFSDQVPLGYRTTIVGELSIAIDSFEGLFGAADVIIEDKLVNVSHNLKSGPYTFATGEGVFNDRFVLKYTDKTLGTDDLDKGKGGVIVSVKNKIVKINSALEQLDKVVIYDLLGKAVFKKINVNVNELEIPNLNLGHQVLIVKTTLQNGAVVTNKIVY
jgi:hypothetical protein